VYYHHPDYQRQRHEERMAQMREDYRRAQPHWRHEWQRRKRVRSIWEWMRQHSVRRAPAYRA
jgi:hypothetical protein